MNGAFLDITHDPARRSWVASANLPETEFPLQNLPLGLFRSSPAERPRIGVAIGDRVLDLVGTLERGHLDLPERLAALCHLPRLNELMGCALEWRLALRRALSDALGEGSPLAADRAAHERLLRPLHEIQLLLPAEVGDYSDFYASVDHATNVGSMFRPDNPLLPNYKWVPIGYHGRASSVVVSGTPVRRPLGQAKPADAAEPRFGPSRQLDYELEVGVWVGEGTALGSRIPIEDAERHLFGICLLNDWSARDIQAWEYQPLGPFLAKSFATTVSPWVITMEALAPFRVPAPPRPATDPAPLPYLTGDADRARGGVSITLEVRIQSARMRERALPAMRVSRTDFRRMYWTLAQLVTHHASGGCNLRPGDILGSGTVSGPDPDERGCLLERTWRGREPLTLPTGETRSFLEDGDEVILNGYCERPGARRIGLGECRGTIIAASGTEPVGAGRDVAGVKAPRGAS
ncbi:MAG TPA: fumarylacetoacetase [Gemmatimonadales bacterium]|nr:fumarylacetoacetase [Gemmatimonadales bacterium]